MPFDTFNDRLKGVAEASVQYFRSRYAQNDVKIEQEIHPSIMWTPSFHLLSEKLRIVAVEVSDSIYPDVLRAAAHDIGHHDFPISVYQALSLEIFLSDPKQQKINALKKHGFGIVTVSADGEVAVQHPCIPIAQYISSDRLELEIKDLPKAFKLAFRAAHQTYITNEGQGLQAVGQIVEGILVGLAKGAVRRKKAANNILDTSVANLIDALWDVADFIPHRVALGGARDFIKKYRNTTSHPPATAKAAAEKLRRCKTGFMTGIDVAKTLKRSAKQLKYDIKIFTT